MHEIFRLTQLRTYQSGKIIKLIKWFKSMIFRHSFKDKLTVLVGTQHFALITQVKSVLPPHQSGRNVIFEIHHVTIATVTAATTTTAVTLVALWFEVVWETVIAKHLSFNQMVNVRRHFAKFKILRDFAGSHFLWYSDCNFLDE